MSNDNIVSNVMQAEANISDISIEKPFIKIVNLRKVYRIGSEKGGGTDEKRRVSGRIAHASRPDRYGASQHGPT